MHGPVQSVIRWPCAAWCKPCAALCSPCAATCQPCAAYLLALCSLVCSFLNDIYIPSKSLFSQSKVESFLRTRASLGRYELTLSNPGFDPLRDSHHFRNFHFHSLLLKSIKRLIQTLHTFLQRFDIFRLRTFQISFFGKILRLFFFLMSFLDVVSRVLS